MKKLYMDIHVLQTLPPSCVNRDDTGSPKTAVYGGATRARVSSQAWKKAVRDYFREHPVAGAEMGIRTKSLLPLLTRAMMEKVSDLNEETAAKFVTNTVNLAAKEEIITTKVKKKKQSDADEDELESKNEALFFITPKQIDKVAELAAEWYHTEQKPKNEKVISALHINCGMDEALFGRMVAQNPTLNTEAAAQVAHSISTHRIFSEYDYFTAADDVKNENHAGAGHIGTTEFYSATLYRYATVAVHELTEHLAGKAPEAAVAFLRAFVLSMPDGKRNSFANNNLPYTVFVTLRNDMPVNLSGAFEKPVEGNSGYEAESVAALENHTKELYQDWLGKPEQQYYCGSGDEIFGTKMAFGTLAEQILQDLQQFAAGGEDA